MVPVEIQIILHSEIVLLNQLDLHLLNFQSFQERNEAEVALDACAKYYCLCRCTETVINLFFPEVLDTLLHVSEWPLDFGSMNTIPCHARAQVHYRQKSGSL